MTGKSEKPDMRKAVGYYSFFCELKTDELQKWQRNADIVLLIHFDVLKVRPPDVRTGPL